MQPLPPGLLQYPTGNYRSADLAERETAVSSNLPSYSRLRQDLFRQSAQTPLVSVSSPEPQAVQEEERSCGMGSFFLIKVVANGILGGIMTSMVFGIPFFKAVGLDMGIGLTESLIVKKLMEGKSPFTARILRRCSWLTGGPDVPPDQMTPVQKNRCLAPISALLAFVTAFVAGGVRYFQERKADPAKKKIAYEKFVKEAEVATSWRKILYKARAMGYRLENLKILKKLQERPLLLMLAVGAGALFSGYFQGYIAAKIAEIRARSEAKTKILV